MSKKQEILLTDSINDLFDIEMAFTRIQALSDVLLDYIMDNHGTNNIKTQDNIDFTLMTIRDYAKFYSNQVQALDIVNGKLKLLKAKI